MTYGQCASQLRDARFATYLLVRPITPSTLELIKVVCGGPSEGEAISEGTLGDDARFTYGPNTEALSELGESPVGLLSARARAKLILAAVWASLSLLSEFGREAVCVTPRRSLPLVHRLSDWCVRRPLSTLSERCPSPLSDVSRFRWRIVLLASSSERRKLAATMFGLAVTCDRTPRASVVIGCHDIWLGSDGLHVGVCAACVLARHGVRVGTKQCGPGGPGAPRRSQRSG